jgi:DNA-binding transcriptional LysR family regulator
MLNPQLLATFATIVSAGSISAAAVRLGCGKSVVSRQLARLEADLGTRLIQRTTRTLTLTEVGKAVLAQAQHIEQALRNVADISGQAQQTVRGPLRIACPRPLGQRHLVPMITEFTQLHPLVEITLLVEDRLTDLVAEQIDVAIRVAHLDDSSLVATQLADNPRVLVAAPPLPGTRRHPHHTRRPDATRLCTVDAQPACVQRMDVYQRARRNGAGPCARAYPHQRRHGTGSQRVQWCRCGGAGPRAGGAGAGQWRTGVSAAGVPTTTRPAHSRGLPGKAMAGLEHGHVCGVHQAQIQ